MTFDDLERALAARSNYELQAPPAGGFGLERMRALMKALDHPERSCPVVHVAGTKGKGTTVAALASTLHAAGLRVGWTTSPHLTHFSERVRLGPGPAPEALWTAAGEAVLAASAAEAPGATWFELITAIAFEVFRRAKVDAAIVEVGLGGRLDATNVVHPTVSVITRIAKDHTRLLGDDLADIAREKAGILTRGVPLVAAPGGAVAERALVLAAGEAGVPLWRAGKALHTQEVDGVLHLVTPWGEHQVRPPLPAAFFDDLLLAAAACHLLEHHLGRPLSESLTPGVERLRWRGRFDWIEGDPDILVDGAHCPTSAHALATSWRARFGDDARAVLLLAASTDKDLLGILEPLAPLCASAITSQVHPTRAADPGHLGRLAKQAGIQRSIAEPCPQRALRLAMEEARSAGLPVLATGSLYLAGDVLQRLSQETGLAWFEGS